MHRHVERKQVRRRVQHARELLGRDRSDGFAFDVADVARLSVDNTVPPADFTGTMRRATDVGNTQGLFITNAAPASASWLASEAATTPLSASAAGYSASARPVPNFDLYGATGGVLLSGDTLISVLQYGTGGTPGANLNALLTFDKVA